MSARPEIPARGSNSIHALDVSEALVDATYTRERKAYLTHANLGIEKLRFMFRLAFDSRRFSIECKYPIAYKILMRTT
jgi:hypothetical protein